MSKADYDAKIKEIEAIPGAFVKLPNMPVAIALQESEDLFAWCQSDKKELVKAGLDWNLVLDLPMRTGACRHIQSIWSKDFKTQETAAKEWMIKAPAAFDLRDSLVHHFFHGFNSQSDLILKVRAIDEGSSNADMLQDLSDLHVLGNANLPLLKAINLDLSLLQKAHDSAAELSALLAIVNGERHEDNESKQLRDKAYTYMKEAVDEIRRQGQYVYWKNEGKKKGYVSQYFKRMKNKKKQETEANGQPV